MPPADTLEMSWGRLKLSVWSSGQRAERMQIWELNENRVDEASCDAWHIVSARAVLLALPHSLDGQQASIVPSLSRSHGVIHTILCKQRFIQIPYTHTHAWCCKLVFSCNSLAWRSFLIHRHIPVVIVRLSWLRNISQSGGLHALFNESPREGPFVFLVLPSQRGWSPPDPHSPVHMCTCICLEVGGLGALAP